VSAEDIITCWWANSSMYRAAALTTSCSMWVTACAYNFR
jgi:hypothetical protein